MQVRKKITIKSVTKAPPKIKIRKRLMSGEDVRSLTTQVMRFNNIIPLKPQTIPAFMDKTSDYLRKVETKSTNLIRIKSVRLYRDRFNH